MKFKISLYIFLIAIITFVPSRVFADKILFFTPTRVLLNDQDRVEVINVSNLSDITRAYKVSFQDLVMTYDGITTPVDNFEYTAKRMLRFVPRQFTLEPGERQSVRIMSRKLPNMQAGEYHTHIRFLEDLSQRNELNPKDPGQVGAAIEAPMAYEALIPAVVSHGSVNAVLALKSAEVSKVRENTFKANLVLTRSGNAQGVAFVDTNYIAPNGEVSASVTPRRTIYIYREIDERKKDYEFELSPSMSSGGKLEFVLYDNSGKDASPLMKQTVTLP